MIRSTLHVTKHTPVAPRGMVVAEHPLGAGVGAAVLARGGNAVDAAVATALAMTVVEPFMSTIAGSGTMLVYLARRDETIALDFKAVAPLGVTETTFPVIGGVSDALFPWPKVEGDANVFGHRSVAVPGSIAGLAAALARWGTMEWADTLRPAIELAREGFVADWYLALKHAQYLEELAAFPETARVYLRNGRSIYRPPTMNAGDRVAYPDLAQSLELIAREGPSAFYRGVIADAITHEMARHGGLITKDDLAAYEVRQNPPLSGRYRDLDLAFSPGATGGITALEMLNIWSEFPSTAADFRTVNGLDLRARSSRRAFLDRFAELGDPAFVKVDWERLASAPYARERAREIRRDRTDASSGNAARGQAAPSGGRRTPAGATDECTTHVSVIDRHRNMVSLTHTAVSLWGSRVVVPGTGILLNNGMIWFDPEPGKPNSVAAGKRVLVNMVPVLGFRRGEPALTLGAPGGRKIVSAIPQVLANLADLRLSPQAAIEAPRVHSEGPVVEVDDRVGDKAVAALRRRGHEVTARTETYSTLNFARPIMIRVTRHGLEAGLDHLGAAAAAGS
jgi:gamma-glutamyltranspeptidase/glutathione hydrolase